MVLQFSLWWSFELQQLFSLSLPSLEQPPVQQMLLLSQFLEQQLFLWLSLQS
jgi:hypothetical protein